MRRSPLWRWSGRSSTTRPAAIPPTEGTRPLRRPWSREGGRGGGATPAADALGHRAAAGMEGMRALGRLAFVLGAAGEVIADVDALDDEHLVLEDHDALGV